MLCLGATKFGEGECRWEVLLLELEVLVSDEDCWAMDCRRRVRGGIESAVRFWF